MEDLKPEQQAAAVVGLSPSTTISELIDEFGLKEVKRGLSYMSSLSDAQENFKKSASDSDYAKRVAQGLSEDVEDVSDSKIQELQEEWSESMEEGGLGLDD